MTQEIFSRNNNNNSDNSNYNGTFFKTYVVSSEMHEPPYYRDYSSARLLVHSVVTSKYFDLAIAAVIGLNVVTMALEFYMMPKVSLTPVGTTTTTARLWSLTGQIHLQISRNALTRVIAGYGIFIFELRERRNIEFVFSSYFHVIFYDKNAFEMCPLPYKNISK